MQLKEISKLEEMLDQIDLIHQLYPNLSKEKYSEYLQKMIPHNYKQLLVLDNNICIGLTGFWSGIKLWSGPYIEIDNFIVDEQYRQKGIGKLMTDYINDLAIKSNCNIIVLDAFTQNFKAHRFYYNQGYAPRGFHFVKTLNIEGLS
jgi:GNAT superfamily N-acetyltransferase